MKVPIRLCPCYWLGNFSPCLKSTNIHFVGFFWCSLFLDNVDLLKSFFFFFVILIELRIKSTWVWLRSLSHPRTFPGWEEQLMSPKRPSLWVTRLDGTRAASSLSVVFYFSTSSPKVCSQPNVAHPTVRTGRTVCCVFTHHCLRKSIHSLTVALVCHSWYLIFLSECHSGFLLACH